VADPITIDRSELRYGYLLVARLGRWSVARRQLTADVVEIVNRVGLLQTDLVLVLHKTDGQQVRQTLTDIELIGTTLRARLKGDPTRAHARTRDDAA
jgi:hypothetical protein